MLGSRDRRDSPNLYATSVCIIDQKQVGLGIVGEVALRDILPIAGKIDKADRPIVEHPQEAGRPAAVLDVRLSLRAGGGEKDTRLRADEGRKVRSDPGLPGTRSSMR